MKDSGDSTPILEREKDYRSGKMDPSMKAGGKIIKLMEEEDSYMLNAIYTRASGNPTKPMVTVSIYTWMVQPTRVVGYVTSSMVVVQKPGLMELCMKGFTGMARRRERVCSNGQMEAFLEEISGIMISRGMESIRGAIGGIMRESGKPIRCMAEAFLIGRMEESTLASI